MIRTYVRCLLNSATRRWLREIRASSPPKALAARHRHSPQPHCQRGAFSPSPPSAAGGEGWGEEASCGLKSENWARFLLPISALQNLRLIPKSISLNQRGIFALGHVFIIVRPCHAAASILRS